MGDRPNHYRQVAHRYLQVASLEMLALVESMKQEGPKKKNISTLTLIQTPMPPP